MEVVENGLVDAERSRYIYLSGDAEEILQNIEDDKIYIIGGLVDRNRHKVRNFFNVDLHLF
jgi:Trm5-related predicted tRNA methylase